MSTKSLTAADVGIVVSLSFDAMPSDCVTSVAAAISEVVISLTVNVRSYGSPSVPLSVSVQSMSIPPPSTNFTSLAV